MGADLNNIIKTQRLSNDHVQFLVYQILRGLKVCNSCYHFVAYMFYISVLTNFQTDVPLQGLSIWDTY